MGLFYPNAMAYELPEDADDDVTEAVETAHDALATELGRNSVEVWWGERDDGTMAVHAEVTGSNRLADGTYLVADSVYSCPCYADHLVVYESADDMSVYNYTLSCSGLYAFEKVLARPE